MTDQVTYVIATVFILVLCSYCFHYSVKTVFGKEAPWYLCAVGGIATSAFIIPVSVICFVLELCGVRKPFIN